jgi:hypothetical protein
MPSRKGGGEGGGRKRKKEEQKKYLDEFIHAAVLSSVFSWSD